MTLETKGQALTGVDLSFESVQTYHITWKPDDSLFEQILTLIWYRV